MARRDRPPFVKRGMTEMYVHSKPDRMYARSTYKFYRGMRYTVPGSREMAIDALVYKRLDQGRS